MSKSEKNLVIVFRFNLSREYEEELEDTEWRLCWSRLLFSVKAKITITSIFVIVSIFRYTCDNYPDL